MSGVGQLAVLMHSRQSRQTTIKQIKRPQNSSANTIVSCEMFVIRQHLYKLNSTLVAQTSITSCHSVDVIWAHYRCGSVDPGAALPKPPYCGSGQVCGLPEEEQGALWGGTAPSVNELQTYQMLLFLFHFGLNDFCFAILGFLFCLFVTSAAVCWRGLWGIPVQASGPTGKATVEPELG